jgi:hypothetical protein
MVVSLESAVSISDDVIFRELHGELVLLNLASGVYFGLNDVGARMWQLLAEHHALRRVFELLQDEYDVAPATLEQDLRALVGQLSAQGLVRVDPV